MVDAKWKPDDTKNINQNNDTHEKVYSEVTSGLWYKRTHEKMIMEHRRNKSPYPPLLIAIVLGKYGTLCDKIGRVKSEPILVSISNILYSKRKINSAWFCLGFVPSYPKTQLESQKDGNRVNTKELHNEFYHGAMSYILGDIIKLKKNNGIPIMVNLNGNITKRTCYIEVAFSVGDASGNHKLCGHYVNFSGNISRKQRECDV